MPELESQHTTLGVEAKPTPSAIRTASRSPAAHRAERPGDATRTVRFTDIGNSDPDTRDRLPAGALRLDELPVTSPPSSSTQAGSAGNPTMVRCGVGRPVPEEPLTQGDLIFDCPAPPGD